MSNYTVSSSLLRTVTKTVRRPVASALRPGLNLRPVHVGFVVDNESLGQVRRFFSRQYHFTGACTLFVCKRLNLSWKLTAIEYIKHLSLSVIITFCYSVKLPIGFRFSFVLFVWVDTEVCRKKLNSVTYQAKASHIEVQVVSTSARNTFQ